jgi:hypothetical protein
MKHPAKRSSGELSSQQGKGPEKQSTGDNFSNLELYKKRRSD